MGYLGLRGTRPERSIPSKQFASGRTRLWWYAKQLGPVLALLNQSFSPHNLYGAKPSGEDEV